MLTLSEEKRRMDDMMKMYSMGEPLPETHDADGETLILNVNHPLVDKVMSEPDSENSKLIEQQLYDLALLSNKSKSLTLQKRSDARRSKRYIKLGRNHTLNSMASFFIL